MNKFNRRQFIKALGAASAIGGLGFPLIGKAGAAAKVIVIGGGYGGATCAKYLRIYDSDIDVTLIEKKEQYVSCPLSNEVLGGERDIKSLTFGYDGLAKHGVNVVHDEVTKIDPDKKTITTKGGKTHQYDMLVVSPGISFKWGAIEGYDEAASELMPHAWKAGKQTEILRKQLEAMENGGTVIISAPPNPFRCPPGPYERAAQIAFYLSQHKPKSKVVILDSKDKFSKQGLFMEGWEALYPGKIDWVMAANDGKVVGVDAEKGIVMTEFAEHKPAVANIIPPQKAGTLAEIAGLTNDSGWCPVDQGTFESTIHKDVYVIGDASIAGKMPKSGYAANSQGKVCAMAIATKVAGQAMPVPSYVNTCYSLVGPHYGISVAMVYELKDGEVVGVKGAGGLSPMKAPESTRRAESIYARSWYRNITNDIFS